MLNKIKTLLKETSTAETPASSSTRFPTSTLVSNLDIKISARTDYSMMMSQDTYKGEEEKKQTPTTALNTAGINKDENEGMKRQECPICHESSLSLRFLTCKHCMCLTCINSMSIVSDLGQKYVKCPFDRLDTLLPSNDATFLWSKLNVELPCESCDAEKPIGDCWWCQTCQMSICSECAMKKHRMHDCDHWQDYNIVKDCFRYYAQHFPRHPENCLKEKEKIDKFCSDLKQFLCKAVDDEEWAWNAADMLHQVFGGNKDLLTSRQNSGGMVDKADKKLNLASKVVSKFGLQQETLQMEFSEGLGHPVRLPLLEQVLSLCYDATSGTDKDKGPSQNEHPKMESGAKPKHPVIAQGYTGQTPDAQGSSCPVASKAVMPKVAAVPSQTIASMVPTVAKAIATSTATDKPSIVTTLIRTDKNKRPSQNVQPKMESGAKLKHPVGAQGFTGQTPDAQGTSCSVASKAVVPKVAAVPPQTIAYMAAPKVVKDIATSTATGKPSSATTPMAATVSIAHEVKLIAVAPLNMCYINEHLSLMAILNPNFICIVSSVTGTIVTKKGWPNQAPKNAIIYCPQVTYRAGDNCILVTKCSFNDDAGVLMVFNGQNLQILKQTGLPGTKKDCWPRLICVLNDNSTLIAHCNGSVSTMWSKQEMSNFVHVWSSSSSLQPFSYIQKTKHTDMNVILISGLATVVYKFTLTNQRQFVKFEVVSSHSGGPLVNIGMTTWIVDTSHKILKCWDESTEEGQILNLPKCKDGTPIDVDVVCSSYPYLFIISRTTRILRVIYLPID